MNTKSFPILSALLLIVVVVSVSAKSRFCTFDGHKFQKTFTPPGRCMLLRCWKDGSVTGKLCPAIDVAENCNYIPADVTGRAYPGCCPQYDCHLAEAASHRKVK